MFIGENLSNLRTMHGYSRKQLSELLNVTEQAVWQYENSYTAPKLQVVNELSRIFNVKSKYFYANDILSQFKSGASIDNINVMNIAYRAKILNTISKTQSEAKHVEYLDAFINYITAKITLPSANIIKLREEVIKYLNNTDDNRITQINKVARLARTRLDLSASTNDELMYLIEKSGIFVFEKAIGEDIDAYSLWTKNDRAYIILGNMKKSSVRRNFDIAHELGHLLLHYRIEFVSLDRKEHKNIENEANLFAGGFLLPEDEFIDDIKDILLLTNPDAYIDLKRKWKTSLQVLGYRATQLELLQSKEHRNFYATMHRKNYLKIEPLDEIIPLQKPTKIRTIVDFVVNKGLLNIQKMVDNDWKVDISFFYGMTGIDSKFFEKYFKKESDFSLQNIIDLQQRSSP